MTKEALSRLQRIDYLISIKGTGNPSQLARKMGISKRSVYDYLNLMREFGAPIKYSHERGSYYYDEDGTFKVAFLFVKQRIIDGNTIIKSISPVLIITQILI